MNTNKANEQYWRTGYGTGFNVRSQRRNGLEGYQALKLEHQSIPGVIPMSQKFIELCNSINYKVDAADDDNLNATVEISGVVMNNNDGDIGHYFVQHFRIPRMTNFNLPVGKLVQIAYNAGQLKADWDKYPVEIQNFIIDNKLDQLSSFI